MYGNISIVEGPTGEQVQAHPVPLAKFQAKNHTREKNQPNPFNQTTLIRYKIPVGANAQINIYDAAGAMVKTMRAPENGQAQINAGELKAGTYTYALIIDGKPLVSKKMVMLR